MTFLEILETLLIGPLKLVFEIIFDYAYDFLENPGLAIVCLSLIMNLLVLPLYRRADAMQEAIRDIEAKLHGGVAHIKKTFSGDEQMMILQTYYRQNHYKPTDALRGSVSLLLEIPFFIAAYQFLSNLDILDGVSFGPIRNLGAPDGLLVLGGLTINLLPVLMTLINLLSGALYLKGFPLKTKVQLYAMALFFFVFLYSSPSCLLFYWTLNNLFSLIKNIFYKLKNPRKVLCLLAALAGAPLLVFGLFIDHSESLRERAFFAGIGFLLLLPLLMPRLKSFVHISEKKSEAAPDRRIFLLGSLFLTVLVGLFIPSVFIAASPQEFADTTFFYHPLWYLVRSFCYAAGFFLIWMRVFYGLASTKGKVLFDRLVWILSGTMLVNYMFFGTGLGNLSANLQYDNALIFSRRQQLVNFLILAALAVALYFCIRRWRQAVSAILTVSMIALCGMTVRNGFTVRKSITELLDTNTAAASDSEPHFRLSRTGQNVIVIMLDRAMGEFVPYLLKEKPELREKFTGFTYYRNTVSFGGYTNFGSPALLGGYEYTPVEMNRRSDESLASKHNEALKVMPVLFSENGYEVTVCDPPYANYSWVPDLSIYDDYPEINAYITKGHFNGANSWEDTIQNNNRNFFCFSLMKSLPLFLQNSIYERGRYHQIASANSFSVPQDATSISTSVGVNNNFQSSYYVLANMNYLTRFTDEDTDTFLFLANDTTHEPTLLAEPDYTPAQIVDNTEYDLQHSNRFKWKKQRLQMKTDFQMRHYHVNMASFLLLGKWFDYLRANGVYDNTRIILVADHGRNLRLIEKAIIYPWKKYRVNLEYFYPLLMMKDFGSQEFTTSKEFMTNADVPTMAVQGLIDDPVNPFTGKAINNDEKNAHEQFIILSEEFGIKENNGNTFLPSYWASVKDNVWNPDNWTFYKQKTVLDENAAP